MPTDDLAVKAPGSDDAATTTPAPVETAAADATTQADPTVAANPNLQDDDFDAEDKVANVKPNEADNDDDDEDDDEDEAKVEDAEADKAADDKTEPATAKDARITELTAEIDKLKTDMGLEPNADVRTLVAERNLLRELSSTQIRKAGLDLETQLLDMTNPDTGEPYTPEEANYISRRAVVEAEREVAGNETYDLQVKNNQQVIERETLQAMHDFPIFMEKLPDGTPNPDFDEAAANLAGEHLIDAFVTSPDGKTVTNIKRSPYAILKSVADQAAKYKSDSEAKARVAQTEQEANADVPASGSTSHAKVDPGLKDFDEAFDETI